MTIYGYIRKSTEKHSYKHMEYEINEYAAKHNMNIDVWVEETISSRKPLISWTSSLIAKISE